MKQIIVTVFITTIMACNSSSQKNEAGHTGRPEVKIENGLMTPETLWAFGRAGNVCVSPDGVRVAYTVTYYSIPENKSYADVHIMDADGQNSRQITQTAARENALAWLPSGKAIAFLRDGKLWNIDPDNGQEKQASKVEQAIDGFLYSPAGDKILLAIPTKLEKYKGAELYDDLDKSDALVYDDLMYRHWNEWRDGYYNHLYIGNVEDGVVTSVKDMMEGEPYDAPTKPFGDMEEVVWSPDGQTIIYTCKKLKGKDYAFSTNTDLYAYDAASSQTRLLTPDMPGYDKYPKFSPDGKKLLFTSMRRAGYEADKERIMAMDWPGGTMRDLSESLDASPSSMVWDRDGQYVYFTAPFQEAHQIHRLNMATGEIKRLTDGNHDYQHVQLSAGNSLIATRTTFVNPAEIYRVNIADGLAKQISFINKDLLDRLKIPAFEKRFITTTDNKSMVAWVVLPPDFDPGKKYPLLLVCTGGPQGVLAPSFSYRWNYMLMASQGYAVVIPARRGTSGSGQEWCDAISRNHGTQEEQDLLAAIDAVGNEAWADKNRIGATGASYGGYSIFHLAGTHRGRFKAFLAHCGIFNMEFMYTTTEEMFFEEWETGGAPWDKKNAAAQNSYAHSPHLLVQNWDTPIMIVHGEKDFRVPSSQGMAAFNAARMVGVESRLLIFPNETHWVLSPQNGVLWQREFFAWFNKHLKK